MTAETIHDALTLLPGDLVEQADKKRRFPARVIPWKRYAALAACLALVLCSGWAVSRLELSGAKESAAPEAPQEAVRQDITEIAEAPAAVAPAEDAPAEQDICSLPPAPAAGTCTLALPEGIVSVAWIPTPRPGDSAVNYGTDSAIHLFTDRSALDTYLEDSSQEYSLTQLESQCEALTESWFENHDLLLLAVSSESQAPVTAIAEENGHLEICIDNSPTGGSIQDWHILIGAEKNRIPSKDAVVLLFK